MTTINHQYMESQGYYRLIWYGRVGTLPTENHAPSLVAYFAPIEVYRGEPVSHRIVGKAQRRLIPAGDIPRLPINTILNGTQVIQPFGKIYAPFEERTLELDFTQSNLTLFQRFATDEDDCLIVPFSNSNALREDLEYSGVIVGVGDGDDPFAVVIPCFEVFRFFYATSSRLANVFLDSRFLDPGRHVWNPDRSFIDHSEHKAKVWLRQRMLDADARVIAAFAFDRYAVEQGQNIYLNMARGVGLYERALQAIPPFEGQTNVTAECLSFKGPKGQPRILITRLITCSWRPMFDELVFDRDNDGRSTKMPNADTEPMYRGPVIELPEPTENEAIEDEEELSLWDEEPSSQFAPLEIVDEDLVGRFPELESIMASKLPQLETTHHNAVAIRKKQRERWNLELSTIEGIDSNSLLGPALLTGGHPELVTYDSVEEKFQNPPDTEMLRIGKGLANIQRQQLADVEFLAVFLPAIRYENIRIFTLPNAMHRTQWPWFYHDKAKSLRRKGFVAEVNIADDHGYRFRYVMDFEGKGGRQGAIAIVWGKDEETLNPIILARVIAAFARNGGLRLQSPVFEGMNIGFRNHTMDEEFLNNAEKVLERIITTESIF